MNLHQINADGAGPMTCSVDTSGTGASFQAMQITTNVPGTNGLSNAANEDFPLVATMPADATCTGKVGGVSGVCFVKCQNPVGPFGGVVPVQVAAGTGAGAGTAGATSAAAGNSTTAAGNAAGSSASSKGVMGRVKRKGQRRVRRKGRHRTAMQGDRWPLNHFWIRMCRVRMAVKAILASKSSCYSCLGKKYSI